MPQIPYVIGHMVMSVDGKVTGDYLSRPEAENATTVYYELNRAYKADAFACGRVTMEESFTGGLQPDLTPFVGMTVPREDYVADPNARFFAVSFDRRGRLGWTGPCIMDEDPGYGGAHIVEVLCEDVSDAYLAYLQHIGVSYIFGGEHDLDLTVVLAVLHDRFGIQTLLLEGGSEINGAFQRVGLIDELSLVVAPVVASAEDKPLFMDSCMADLTLSETKIYDGGVVWMRYTR